MTRKKSNVKALALAVTCAILAGGYSGLNPVYAAAPVYHDVVKYDSANETLDYEYDAGGGIGTAAIQKINFGNIILDGSSGVGAITASSLSLGTMSDVAAAINSKAAKGDVEINKAAIGVLENKTKDITRETDGSTTVDGVNFNGGAVTGVTSINDTQVGGVTLSGGTIEAASGKFKVYNNGAIEAAGGVFKVGSSGTINALGIQTHSNGSITLNDKLFLNAADASLQDKATGDEVSVADMAKTNLNTKNIRVDKDTKVTSSDATYIDGITHAGGVRLADNGVRAEELVLEEGSAQATLTREGLAALNSMVYDATGKINNDAGGKPIIQAGNGSVVGGVKFDNKNITNVDSITVNEGKENQVQITDKGIVVGLTSAAINGDGFYAGGHNYNDAKAALDGKDGKIKGAGGKFGVDDQGNVTTTGDIKGKDITASGNLTVDGDVEVKKDLKVTGNITGADITASGALKGKTLGIGATGSEFTVDTVGNVKANGITTSDTTTNKIGGVTLAGSDINARNLTLTGTLTAAKYNATDIEATNSIKVGATTMTNGKLDLGSNGTVDFGANELNDAQVGNINNVIQSGGVVQAADGSVIGGVSFSAKDITGVKDLTATGKVTAATISDGTASLSGGALTGLASVNIGGNTTIDNTGIKTNKLIVGSGLNATTIDDANGVVSAKGEIGAVKFSGSGKLDNVTAIDGVSVAQNSGSAAGGLTFGGNAIIGATGIPFQSTGFKVDDDGDVEGKTFTTAADGTGNRSTLASGQLTIDPKNTWTKDNGIIASNVKVGTNELKGDGLHVGTNTLVKDGEITVGAGNSWSMANGIAATKASINGVTIGETAGKAVFNKAGKSTTIDGDAIETGKITADELLIDKISLGKDGSSNISIDKDGHVQTKGDIKITDAAGNVMSKLSQDQATFGKDAANQTNINNGKLKAKAKNTANQQAEFNFDENGLTVSGQNAAGDTSSFGFNAANGIGTFTGQDNSTTAINGSAITSTNGGATGVLDGSNMKLTNGANSTALTAGGVTFIGADGRSDATGVKNQTTIDGGIITTDTLNVQRIELGDKLVDSNGTAFGSNLSMDNQGNFSAAGGNFTVTGGSGADKGAMTNTVGNTTLKTDNAGASMSYAGTVTSNVSVGNNNAKVSAGAGSIDVTNESITSKVGGTTVETKDGSFSVKGNTNNGMKIDTNTGETIFTGAAGEKGGKTTTINGGTITTDTLNVERINLGGELYDSNGTPHGSNLSMDKQGNFSAAGGNFKVNGADGAMTNTVGNATFETKADSIGGVVTNGTVKMRQELTAEGVKVTDELGDPANYTQITNKDVSITDPKNTGKRINLSDLGQLNDLDGELTARSEYTSNPTAVGAINAEAGIRREEVARLDNRIDDVNNRVDKVGAMAAAIASLKSIGYDPQAPSEFSIGLGQYKGETGVAMGFFHYPNKNFMINVSLSTAGGETMGGIGATWRFGHKSPQKLLDEQREAQARKELAAAEKYQAAAKLAKEAQERAEYAAKLARQAQVSADNAKAAADATQAKHFQ